VGKAAIPIAESRAQHIFGWFAIATIVLRLDHESLDSTNMYVEAGTELKRRVLDALGRRIAEPAAAATSRAARVPQEPSTRPKYVAPASPIACNGAHIRPMAT
jgi:hypothetical protein